MGAWNRSVQFEAENWAHAVDPELDHVAVLERIRRPPAVGQREHFASALPDVIAGLAVPAQERPRNDGGGRFEAGGAPLRTVDVQGRRSAPAAVFGPTRERVSEVRRRRQRDLCRRGERQLTLRGGTAAVDRGR